MLHLFEVPRNWTIWDLGMFKWASIVFGIVVGAYIHTLVKSHLWVFIVVFVLLAVRPMYVYFMRE